MGPDGKNRAGPLLATVGTVCYVLWGLLHLYAAWLSFTLDAGVEDAFVTAKLKQNGWNLALISLACIGVAVALNRRNSRLGYAINAVMVSLTDIGYLVLIYLPGISDDLLGPILWIVALTATTAAQRLAPTSP